MSIFRKRKTTRIIVPPPTKQEIALQASQLEVAQAQLQAIQDQSTFQREQFDLLRPQVEQQVSDAQFAREQAEALAPLQQGLLEQELARIERGGAATPEQQRLIGEVTERAIASGESDIAAFQQRGLDLLANELAPSLGLRPGDSPIVDRGLRFSEEGLRLQASLAGNLRGAQAQAELNFPLAVQQLQSGATQFQQSFATQKQQFAESLRQRAFANRLNLTAGTGTSGLNLINVTNPNTAAALGSLQNLRLGSAKTTTSIRDPLGDIGKLISGAGSIAGIFSSREFKEAPDKHPRDSRHVDHEQMLEAVERLPVERWRYKPGLGLDDDEHVGPYAEDVHDTFRVGENRMIHPADANGIALSAIKGLAKKVRALEHAAQANNGDSSLDPAPVTG